MTDPALERRLDRIEAQLDAISAIMTSTATSLATLSARLERLEAMEVRLEQQAKELSAHGVWIKVLGGAVGTALVAIATAWFNLVSGGKH